MTKSILERFKEYWERVSIPFVLIMGLASALAKFQEDVRKLSLKLVSGSALLVALGWLIYVNTLRKPSPIDKKIMRPAFSNSARLGSSVLFLIALLVFIWTLVPAKPFLLPTPSLMMRNDFKKDLLVDNIGDFYLIVSVAGFVDTVVGRGKFKLKSLVQGSHDLSQGILVPAGRAVGVDCGFIRPELYKSLWEDFGCYIRFVLMSRDGSTAKSELIPFRKDNIIGEYVYIRFHDAGQQPGAADHE
jgi:hypothetical protein